MISCMTRTLDLISQVTRSKRISRLPCSSGHLIRFSYSGKLDWNKKRFPPEVLMASTAHEQMFQHFKSQTETQNRSRRKCKKMGNYQRKGRVHLKLFWENGLFKYDIWFINILKHFFKLTRFEVVRKHHGKS